MTDDDVRWADAALRWARGGVTRDAYDEAVFARLDAGAAAGGTEVTP